MFSTLEYRSINMFIGHWPRVHEALQKVFNILLKHCLSTALLLSVKKNGWFCSSPCNTFYLNVKVVGGTTFLCRKILVKIKCKCRQYQIYKYYTKIDGWVGRGWASSNSLGLLQLESGLQNQVWNLYVSLTIHCLVIQIFN